MGNSQDLYKKAKTLIPGGTQLLSKRPEMFLPDQWPAYFDHAKGIEVWDLDEKKYFDFSYMGIGANILGYCDEDVDREVVKAVSKGTMNTLNSPEEVKLAELLTQLHPWADMARFARSGGEAMSIAVRIARAYSKKDFIMFSGYHGWHDWYLASNLGEDSALDGHLLPGLEPRGVPRSLKGVAVPFQFNDSEEFLKKFEKIVDSVGAIVFESIRNDAPTKEFLETITSVAAKHNVPIIVDEITAGWRLNCGGAHLLFDFVPDIAVFAKGISNGYPMAAIIGKRHIMQSAQDSFISSTYWTERIGPVAAIATIEKMRSMNVPDHLKSFGSQIKNLWKSTAQDFGLQIHLSGIDPLAHFDFEYDNKLELKTLFTQEMLKLGFLANNSVYSSYAHKNLDEYSLAIKNVFGKIAEAIETNSVNEKLEGPVCHSGFKRLN